MFDLEVKTPEIQPKQGASEFLKRGVNVGKLVQKGTKHHCEDG